MAEKGKSKAAVKATEKAKATETKTPKTITSASGLSDKKKALIAARDKVNSTPGYGPGYVDFASNKKDELTVKYIPTPSLELNNALYGGLAIGRMSEFYGAESIGKTSLALDIIGFNMQRDPNFMAGWFETEETFDIEYATTFGIDPNRLTVWLQQDYSAEGGLDVLRAILSTGALNIIVVNSVAALSPKKEIADNMGDQNVALTPRLMSKLMRVTTGPVSKLKSHIVFINQLREKIGGYGNPETTTGGRALRHHASQRLGVSRHYAKQGEKPEVDRDIGGQIDVKVAKNNTAKLNPYTSCTYSFEFGKGIQVLYEMPDMSRKYGILQQKGAWWSPGNQAVSDELHALFALDAKEDIKWGSRKALLDNLKSCPEFFEWIFSKVTQAIAGNFVTESLSAEEIAAIEEEDRLAAEEAEKLETEEETSTEKAETGE